MFQEPPPPPYTSSKCVLNGIAAAFSTFNNPRGLECHWNSPYGQTFRELVGTYSEGPFLVYSPYTLWLPALVKKEQLLRAEFQALDIPYDRVPSLRVSRSIAKAHVKAQAGVRPSHQPGFSKRIHQEQIRTEMFKEAELDEKVRKLLVQRRILMDKIDELTEKKKAVGVDESMESNADSASFEQEPDIFVALIATAMVPKDDCYSIRAYRKPYYQRGAILIELKDGPSRKYNGAAYVYRSNRHIDKAIEDMIDYCSAYFACYPDAKTVVAFVTGGPMWRWANIRRSETPRWDFMLNTSNRTSAKNEQLADNWPGLFGVEEDPFQLGTPRSDQELTSINQHCLHPLLARIPPVPEYLRSREGEGGEIEEGEPEEEDELGSIDEEPEEWEADRGLWPEDGE